MSAKQLIELAISKGYGVGRNRPGEYRYNCTINGRNCEHVFAGSWSQFVKHIKQIPPAPKSE